MYLTKSDYRLASSCPTKLFYRKSGRFPTADGDEFVRMLAEWGYVVEEIARRLHPGGRTIGFQGTPEAAAERTRQAIDGGDCVLYEATFLAGRMLARVDVLVRRGDVLELVEVKSGSFDGARHRALLADGHPGVFRGKRAPHPILTDDRDKLEDVAFQASVVRTAFPHLRVHPFLMMPDKSVETDIEGLWSWFRIETAEDGGRAVVRFSGDDDRLRANPFLAKVDVSAEVETLRDEVDGRAKVFVGSLFPRTTRIEQPLSLHCKGCELHGTGEGGRMRLFPDCWGDLADVDPTLFELYSVGTVGGRKDRLADRMIAARRIGLFDIDEADLVTARGTVGPINQRQLIQLRNTRIAREWVSEGLADALDAFAYPLHFIDFETMMLPVPPHAGMRPYETLAFQWSLHTVPAPGAAPEHRAWLNPDDAFPNFAFARTLRDALGDGGTVFTWSSHERTVVQHVRAQLASRGEADDELARWLEVLTDRLEDLEEIAKEHYFHPRMGGSTSIKRVVEAVWSDNPTIRAAFPDYAAADDSPYRALPPMRVGGRDVSVADGTGAIRAYQGMTYGAESGDPDARAALRDLLLRYCRLDTAAMVMVWMHWRGGRT